MTASHLDPAAGRGPDRPSTAADLLEGRALLAALPWVVDLVRRPEVAATWDRASALEGYTVGGLVGHLYRAVERTGPGLDEEPGPGDGPPALLTDWYLQNRFDGVVGLDDPMATWLRDDGQALAADGPDALADRIADLAASLASRLATEPSDRFVRAVRTPRPVPLADYLASRVVEVVVHCDDLACSLVPAAGAAPADPPPSPPSSPAPSPLPPPPAEAVDVAVALLVTGARQRSGDLPVLRALTRAERVRDPADVLRAL